MNTTNQSTNPINSNVNDAFHAVLRTTSDWLNVPSPVVLQPQGQDL